MEFTSDDIKKKIEGLPKGVRDYLYSKDMHAQMQQLGAKHQLHIDQIGELESEVAAAMIGIADTAQLPENLSEALNLDSARSQALVKDINEQIFLKIRDTMKTGVIPAAPAPAAPVSSVPPVVTPLQRPTPPAPVASKPPAPKPQELHPADVMLSQKTVTVAPPAPKTPPAPGATPAPAAPKTPQGAPATPTPAAQGGAPATPEPPAPLGRSTSMGEAKPYAADPYREPIQ